MAEKDQMDLNKVKELVALMRDNDLVEVELTDGKNRIHLKRPQPVQPVISQAPMGMMPMMAPQAGFSPAPAAMTSVPAAAPVPQEALLEITSPIIGTYYSASSPDADPYAKAGDRIKPDTVVCIIEAMKVMNEIKAEVAGTVVEVLCRAGQPVEFGQVLFRVRPD